MVIGLFGKARTHRACQSMKSVPVNAFASESIGWSVPVRDRGEPGGYRSAYSLSGRVRVEQLRVVVFQLEKLVVETVVLAVGDLGLVQGVVLVVVPPDYVPKVLHGFLHDWRLLVSRQGRLLDARLRAVVRS